MEYTRPGRKKFGSGQLIFENWSGGPVDVFSEPQPKFSKSNEYQHAEMDADAEVACAGCQVMAADSLCSRHGERGKLEGGLGTDRILTKITRHLLWKLRYNI